MYERVGVVGVVIGAIRRGFVDSKEESNIYSGVALLITFISLPKKYVCQEAVGYNTCI